MDGCGEVGEAGWKRQVVVRDLNNGVEEDATAWTRPDVHPRLSQYRPEISFREDDETYRNTLERSTSHHAHITLFMDEELGRHLDV